MTTETLSYTFTAGQVIKAPGSRFLMIVSSTYPVDIRSEGVDGSPVVLSQMSAGSVFGPRKDEDPPDFWRLTSAQAQNVKIIVSDDPVSLAAAVTIVGTAVTQELVPGTLSASFDVALANLGTLNIGANLARRKLCIGSLSTNSGSVRIAGAGLAASNRGLELQPGLTWSESVTGGVDVYNGSGAAQAITVAELV